jgi:diguanylate cyclase (GGDEF)-like protein
LRSLRFKVLLLAALLLAGSEVATVAAVLVTANRDVYQRARESLRVGATVLDEFMQSRSRALRTTVRVLAADYGFREAVATHDLDTIRSVLENHGRRADADVTLLIEPDGRLIASTFADEEGASAGDYAHILEAAEADDDAEPATLTVGGDAYQMITVPLRAPVTVAWVSMGFRINDELAAKLKTLTGLEVSFLTPEGAGRRVLGSTLSRQDRLHLEESAPSTLAVERGTTSLGRLDDLALERAFAPGSAQSVLLQKSLQTAMAPYRDLRLAIVAIGVLALIAALVGAAVLSRRVMRPVQRLVEASRRMNFGDYSRGVDLDMRDELGELASAFNAMQASIAERERDISHQAYHDAVTGLPNRLLVLERMRVAIPPLAGVDDQLCVMVFGLDRYADVVASLGHEIADEVLRRMAQRLAGILPEHALIGRLEADEFVVVVAPMSRSSATAVAEDAVAVLGAGLTVEDIQLDLNATVGIALAPEHGAVADELLRRASVARHDARTAGDRVHFYHEGRDERHRHQLAIVGDLRRAVDAGELHMLLQPKLSLRDGKLCAAEALVRWQHPRLGLLTPDAFIPFAERYGNIVLVTRWMLERAIGGVAAWLEAGLELEIAVNLSEPDLRDPGLPAFVAEQLRQRGVSASHLCV